MLPFSVVVMKHGMESAREYTQLFYKNEKLFCEPSDI